MNSPECSGCTDITLSRCNTLMSVTRNTIVSLADLAVVATEKVGIEDAMDIVVLPRHEQVIEGLHSRLGAFGCSLTIDELKIKLFEEV